MTKHEAGESKYEREYRRILERNNKTLTDLHIKPDKFYEENARKQGEKYGRITVKFSDKEKDEAGHLMELVGKAGTPEDGKSYEEIAREIWGEKEWMESDVDYLLYVVEMIAMDYTFNMNREAGGRVLVVFIPYTKFIEKNGKPVKMVFNAARNDAYMYEAGRKFSFGTPIEREEIVGDKQYQAFTEIVDNLKGINGQPVDGKYVSEVLTISNKIYDIAARSGLSHLDLKDIPELDEAKFNDAMYMFIKKMEHKHGITSKGWKRDHGYLEGK